MQHATCNIAIVFIDTQVQMPQLGLSMPRGTL